MVALSGMESMFRAMGLGQILDMAKSMAENGTFDKIIKFADEAESLRLKVEELIDEVKQMRRENAEKLGIEATTIISADSPVEPYSNPADFNGTSGYDFRHSDANNADKRS